MFIDPFSVFICGYTVSRCVWWSSPWLFAHTHTVPCLPRCSSSMSVCVCTNSYGPNGTSSRLDLPCYNAFAHTFTAFTRMAFTVRPWFGLARPKLQLPRQFQWFLVVRTALYSGTLFPHTIPEHYSRTLFRRTTAGKRSSLSAWLEYKFYALLYSRA